MVELSGVLVPPKEVVRPVLLPSALDHVPAHVALPLAVPVLLWAVLRSISLLKVHIWTKFGQRRQKCRTGAKCRQSGAKNQKKGTKNFSM